jgi:hypothetical protein
LSAATDSRAEEEAETQSHSAPPAEAVRARVGAARARVEAAKVAQMAVDAMAA